MKTTYLINKGEYMRKEIVITKDLKTKIKQLSNATEITKTNLIFFLIISVLDNYGISLSDDGVITPAEEIATFSNIKKLRDDFIRYYSGINRHIPTQEKDESNEEKLEALTFTLPEYISDSLRELKKYLNTSIAFTDNSFRITDDYLYSFLIAKQIKLFKDFPTEEAILVKRQRKKNKDGIKKTYSEKILYKLSVSKVIVNSFKVLEVNSGINSYDWMKYILFQYAVKNNFFDAYIEYDISR